MSTTKKSPKRSHSKKANLAAAADIRLTADENAPPPPRTVPVPDPAFAHVMLGPSNEELMKKQAELDALRKASGYPRVEMGLDQKDKDLDAWGDLDYDPLGVTDPLEAMKKRHQKPGFALKLLSNTVNQRLTTRDYRIVKEKNGDPVQFGSMVLGEIPERIAARRRKAVIDNSNDELRSINDQSRLEVEKLKHDAKGMGLTLLEPGEIVRGQTGPDRVMGVNIERGEGPAAA